LKQHLAELFNRALAALASEGLLPADFTPDYRIERSRDAKFGDYACNLAMLLAKPSGQKPRDLAQRIMDRLPASEEIAKLEIAGPGFINIFLTARAYYNVLDEILKRGEDYGRGASGQKILLEFVSANPTGPLHVGHGRGAAYGASLGNLLEFAGHRVHREYYVNDAGRQMDILAASVWLRYLELCGEEIPFPTNAYKGDYVWDIAATLHRDNQDAFRHSTAEVFDGVPPDAPAGGDKEEHIDGIIAQAKNILGAEGYRKVFDLGLKVILDDIRRDLEEFGVTYQEWFSERGLNEKGLVEHGLERLKAEGHTYEKDGALWFRSTDFGDEKDRVLVRDNGAFTYFASDVAYHLNKLERGFDTLINVWGADHHGYIPRVKAAIQGLGGDAGRLSVLLVQFAILFKGGERQQMSTRSGEFVTLRELRKTVGNDATRFFYVLRKSEQHMDFDLELAQSKSNENPVYYVQYAHARIASVLRQLSERELHWTHDPHTLALLSTDHEQTLLKELSRYPEVVESAAAAFEPHQIAYYARDLATAFHTYYNAHTFLVDDVALRNARLSLVYATRHVLRGSLKMLGVSAPEAM
jgi:arginyl-tRNA synthetase